MGKKTPKSLHDFCFKIFSAFEDPSAVAAAPHERLIRRLAANRSEWSEKAAVGASLQPMIAGKVENQYSLVRTEKQNGLGSRRISTSDFMSSTFCLVGHLGCWHGPACFGAQTLAKLPQTLGLLQTHLVGPKMFVVLGIYRWSMEQWSSTLSAGQLEPDKRSLM